jgi:exodeoxyribonuclease V alpha subunit
LPAQPGAPAVTRGSATFRRGDRVLQAVNDYTKEVFNGDLVRPH